MATVVIWIQITTVAIVISIQITTGGHCNLDRNYNAFLYAVYSVLVRNIGKQMVFQICIVIWIEITMATVVILIKITTVAIVISIQITMHI